eukprot:gene25772-11437_t
MAPKRGMSADDKREKLLELFHETGDVFMLKDVEKQGMKKGIVLQSIKDVLQSLVDDDLVHQEKIGASNYFWSFKGETSAKIDTDIGKLEASISASDSRAVELTKMISASKAGKEDSVERAEKMAEMTELKRQVEALQGELAKFKDNDPEAVKAMVEGAALAKAGANRWLDNIDTLRSWCNKQFSGREEELNWSWSPL